MVKHASIAPFHSPHTKSPKPPDRYDLTLMGTSSPKNTKQHQVARLNRRPISPIGRVMYLVALPYALIGVFDLMAWTTMHFAAGMAGGTVIAGLGCLIIRRGWRWIAPAMTLGGLWALVPDMPRLFREDFPSVPFASTLGSKALENDLHNMGNWFFFHEQLDAQPHEYALLGLIGILVLYNLAILIMMLLEHAQRHSIIHRAYRAHSKSQYAIERNNDYPEMYTTYLPPSEELPHPSPPGLMQEEPLPLQLLNPSDPVIGRIGKDVI